MVAQTPTNNRTPEFRIAIFGLLPPKRSRYTCARQEA